MTQAYTLAQCPRVNLWQINVMSGCVGDKLTGFDDNWRENGRETGWIGLGFPAAGAAIKRFHAPSARMYVVLGARVWQVLVSICFSSDVCFVAVTCELGCFPRSLGLLLLA